MLRALAILSGWLCLGPGLFAQVDRIGVDPRVELLSIVFALAGNPEYQRGQIPSYNQAVMEWFGPYVNHATVQYARQLRQNSGISFDAVVSLAIHINDVESLRERVPLDGPDVKLDRRWRPQDARRFLDLLRDFTEATRFGEFLASQQTLFDLTSARHKALVETADLTWFRRFFGFAANVRYEVVSGLLTGPNSYGPSVIAEDGVLEVYAIQGIPSVDAEGKPVLPSGYLSNLVHELTHSYTNPLIDQNGPALDPVGRRLFQAAQPDMEAQNYGAPLAVLYETLVRACSGRYTREHDGEAAARVAIDYERARGFVWIAELDAVLAAYEADRATYPSLTEFMPALLAALDEISLRAADLVATYEAARPKAIAMTPENDSRQVDPSLTEIAVTFDRPMRSGYSVSNGLSTPAPRITRAGWDATGTVFQLGCVLEAGKDYELRFNVGNSGSFVSADGYSLRLVTLRFRTAE